MAQVALARALRGGQSPEELYFRLVEEGWPPELALAALHKAAQQLPGRIVLRAAAITKQYHQRKVLRGISFEIHAGHVLGVIGPSGVGKTTLLQILAGWLPPDHGQIDYITPHKTVRVSEAKLLIRQTFGFAAQQPSVYPNMTAEENLEHFAALHNVPESQRKSRVNDLLRLVALERQAAVPAGSLSGGQQKRLDIACALVHEPKVLFLDEPVADLDPFSRERVWKLIRTMAGKGVAVVLATHFLNELETVCDEIIALQDGRILARSSPDQLIRKHQLPSLVVLRTKKGEYQKLFKYLHSVHAAAQLVELSEQQLTLHSIAPHELAAKLPSVLRRMRDQLIEIQITPPGLDQAFTHLFKKHKL